jgi:hypothetical protein
MTQKTQKFAIIQANPKLPVEHFGKFKLRSNTDNSKSTHAPFSSSATQLHVNISTLNWNDRSRAKYGRVIFSGKYESLQISLNKNPIFSLINISFLLVSIVVFIASITTLLPILIILSLLNLIVMIYLACDIIYNLLFEHRRKDIRIVNSPQDFMLYSMVAAIDFLEDEEAKNKLKIKLVRDLLWLTQK